MTIDNGASDFARDLENQHDKYLLNKLSFHASVRGRKTPPYIARRAVEICELYEMVRTNSVGQRVTAKLVGVRERRKSM